MPPDSAPPLLAALRAGTRALHARAEAAFVLGDPARVTRSSYAGVLARLAAYYAAAEAALAPWAPTLAPYGVDLAARAKLPLLRRDLAALGTAVPGDASAPPAPAPGVPTAAQAFGVAYVLEGATLGGQLLRRQLGPALGLTPACGLAFFNAYGADVGPMWRGFTDALARFDATLAPHARPAAHADAVAAARAAFLAFERDVVTPTAALARPRSPSADPRMTAPTAPPLPAGSANGPAANDPTTVELLPPGTPVDLTTCDREPVHLIGGVQPYGALLVVDPADLRVRQASANAATLLGADRAVVGAALAALVGAAQADALAAAAAAADDAGRVYHATPIAVGGRAFEVTAHRQAEGLVFEVEPADPEGPSLDLGAFHATVRRTMAAVARGTSVRATAAAVAREVRRVTGFDRVWVYRFHEDWHGEIIAEARHASVEESWLDLHYPAADIPAPARALFLRHWIRLIADVQAAPSPLEPDPSPATGAALDLGDCVLRAVSPVHAEYLTNMGVRASMSVSLVRDGALWGLVSCHHYAGPRRVPHDVRAACELLAQAFSTQLGMVEQAEDRDYALRLGAVRGALLERMAREPDVVDGLLAEPALLLELTGAEGAAVCLAEGECATVGRTPPAADVAALARWLAEHGHDTYATDALGAAFPPAAAHADLASGVLAVALSRVKPYYVLWFRPQAAQTMRWGGDPRAKPVRVGADGVARLSPRGSFAAWEEAVRGRSHPWRRAEVEAARALRGPVVDALLTRADALAALNRQLEQSNRELDDFAYVASHDLKEPLRGIHNYAAMVSEDYAGQPLDDDGLARLGTIRRLTTRLDGLIDSLLEHARVGRLALDVGPVDANEALDDARDRVAVRVAERGAAVRVPRPLPVVHADRERLVEVFANLVSNAVKYGGAHPEVEVGYLDAAGDGQAPTFYVRDRGIGIEPRHHTAVFKLFKRLHARDAHGGGSGAGLTIVQKVVERHGGRVWLESAPGAGTTVFFTLGPGPASVAGAVPPAATPDAAPPRP